MMCRRNETQERDSGRDRSMMKNPNNATIAVLVVGIPECIIDLHPWIRYRDQLAEEGIHIVVFSGDMKIFESPYDAMMLHVWQDWRNRTRFDPYQVLPVMEHYAMYRAAFPDTIQIVLNHTDMSRRPYATAYWRPGDPVLYRTPAYERNELHPFPSDTIWAYEKVWGSACFASTEPPVYDAGFAGKQNGPRGYRERVAAHTATVGIGLCHETLPYPKPEYIEHMKRCRILVCPRGWGEQSRRHWDAWLSGKPVLTDRECDSVEMIPGQRLTEGIHYLVFDDPEEIPDIVSDWSHPSRRDELKQIAENGRNAARSYKAYESILAFFRKILDMPEDNLKPTSLT